MQLDSKFPLSDSCNQSTNGTGRFKGMIFISHRKRKQLEQLELFQGEFFKVVMFSVRHKLNHFARSVSVIMFRSVNGFTQLCYKLSGSCKILKYFFFLLLLCSINPKTVGLQIYGRRALSTTEILIARLIKNQLRQIERRLRRKILFKMEL